MEVLENDQERPAVAREPAEQVEQQLAQPALAVAVGEPRRAGAGRVEPEARQQRGELGAGVVVERVREPVVRDGPQRGDHWRVGELLAAELDRLAVQHEHAAFARARLQLRGQPRLADARLPGEHQHARGAVRRLGEQGVERAQLIVAPDDRPARDPATLFHPRSRPRS